MPLLWLSLAFICGILIDWWSGLSPALYWGLAGLAGFAAVALALIRKKGWLASLAEHVPRLSGWIARCWPADTETALPGFILPWLPLALLLGAARFQMTLPARRGRITCLVQRPPEPFHHRGDHHQRPRMARYIHPVRNAIPAPAPPGRFAVHRCPGSLAGAPASRR